MKHYDSNYEVWDFVEDLKLDFFSGNVVKYLARFTKKDGLKDLNKAIDYLSKMIKSPTKRYEIKKKNYLNTYKDYIYKFLCSEYFMHETGEEVKSAIRLMLSGDFEKSIIIINNLKNVYNF